jgi:hypothetical protein
MAGKLGKWFLPGGAVCSAGLLTALVVPRLAAAQDTRKVTEP